MPGIVLIAKGRHVYSNPSNRSSRTTIPKGEYDTFGYFHRNVRHGTKHSDGSDWAAREGDATVVDWLTGWVVGVLGRLGGDGVLACLPSAHEGGKGEPSSQSASL